MGPNGLYQFRNLHFQPQSKLHFPANCFDSNADSQTKSVSSVVSPSSRFMWHVHLEHPYDNTLKRVLNHCYIPISNKETTLFCFACAIGKFHRLHAPLSTTTYSKPLKLVYIDLCGPSPMPSFNCFRYYLFFVDAYSWFTLIYQS